MFLAITLKIAHVFLPNLASSCSN